MNKIILLLSILTLFIFLSGCKAPGCTTLSWGEAKVEETGFDMKYSAGSKCENINDYWDDIDVKAIISKIQKMKLLKTSDCTQDNYETGEEEIIECPEFVPEIIEFGEVVRCSFGTPPDKGAECLAAPLVIKFDAEMFFDFVYWEFSMYNSDFSSNNTVLFSKKDEKTMSGQFSDNSLTSFAMRFIWVEEEGVEKQMDLNYSVETKE